MKPALQLSAALLSLTAAHAEIHGYPDGPKLPGVPYCVHDPARPQPPVVETAAVISAKPPADAIVLFDGKSLAAWTAGWVIRDGAMVATEKNISSLESFGAMQLHLEWRLPAGRKVDGQDGGNSGIFLMGLYEVQILQSHQNPTYPDGMAGAMYGQVPPLVNATRPQGEWQSYDIAFEPPIYENGQVTRPAKLTLLHNGVFVQNGENFIGPTLHRELASYPPTHPLTAPITLQFHGDPMEFRNILVRPLGARL